MTEQSPRRYGTALPMKWILRFMATSFVYLPAGLILLLLAITGTVHVRSDAIFVLWLFGFVAMMIFGLSYMFASGLTRATASMNSTMSAEYALLNAGIIAFFAGYSGFLFPPVGEYFAAAGLISMLLSVLMHAANIVRAVKGTRNTGARSREDE